MKPPRKADIFAFLLKENNNNNLRLLKSSDSAGKCLSFSHRHKAASAPAVPPVLLETSAWFGTQLLPAEDEPSIALQSVSQPPASSYPRLGGTRGSCKLCAPVSHTPDSWPGLGWGSCRAGAEAWGHCWCWGSPGPPAEPGGKPQPQHTLPGKQHLSAGRTTGFLLPPPSWHCPRPSSPPPHPAPAGHALACLHSGISQRVTTTGEGFYSSVTQNLTLFLLLMCALVLRVLGLGFVLSSLDPQSVSDQTSTCPEDFQHSQDPVPSITEALGVISHLSHKNNSLLFPQCQV